MAEEMEYVTKAEYAEYTKRVDDWQKRQDARLGELENKVEAINEVNQHIAGMQVTLNSMDAKLGEQGKRLESIEKKDGEMWQTVVKYVLSAVIGGVIAYCFVRLGMA